MFNLMISYNPDSWNLEPYQCDKKRYLEHTESYIRDQFAELNIETLNKLKSFPTLFAIEGDKHDSRVGYITNLKVRSDHILIEYKFDTILPPLPAGSLEKLEKVFDIPLFERNRTHWSIKDDNLLKTLSEKGFYSKDQVEAAKIIRERETGRSNLPVNTIDSLNNNHVFIVHGRDDDTKYQVASYITELGLIPIILHEQANLGKTIIEKIETYTNVGFAVVLYTPCDVGSIYNYDQSKMSYRYRARQNVVLEHGYLMAKLGRQRVTALVKGDIETPNDISGVVYVGFDQYGYWKNDLKREILAAGITIQQMQGL